MQLINKSKKKRSKKINSEGFAVVFDITKSSTFEMVWLYPYQAYYSGMQYHWWDLWILYFWPRGVTRQSKFPCNYLFNWQQKRLCIVICSWLFRLGKPKRSDWKSCEALLGADERFCTVCWSIRQRHERNSNHLWKVGLSNWRYNVLWKMLTSAEQRNHFQTVLNKSKAPSFWDWRCTTFINKAVNQTSLIAMLSEQLELQW